METYLRILRYCRNLTPKMVQFILFALLGILFGVFNILLVKPMLDVLFDNAPITVMPRPEFALTTAYLEGMFNHYFSVVVSEYGRFNSLIFICGFIIGMALLANLFRYMERMVASRIRVDIVKNMRMHVFENVTRLHIGYFNNERKGDLLSRFTNDIQEAEMSVFNSLKSVLKEPITIIAHFTVLFMISVKLTLFTVVILPLVGGVIGTIVRRLRKPAQQSQESLGRIVNTLEETFSSMRIVKAFNARNFLIRKIGDEINRYRKSNLSIARKNELASPLSETLGIIVVSVILLYGGNQVFTGNLEASAFILFLTVFATVIQPAKNFANGITSVQKGMISARRVFQVVDTVPVIRNSPDAVSVTSFDEQISFHNVSFAYDKEPVLNEIDLTIKKGKTIALVGPSGGGKSTLVDLIPRFYDPTVGEIRLDGRPLQQVELESLRALMGIVTQESILFNDTIYNNITFGMEHVSEADVIHAAKVANAHDFIMQTENGYQTVIGERGSKLSGGQRQRLSIARAVLKNPPILILDEATSALDSESERLVQEALTNLMQNRTSIVIAHRLSTIRHADEIIVVEGGRIVERGTHDELVGRDGLYRKLSDIQRATAS